ncbi:MAG: putative phosphoribosyl transferase [Fibrobacteres bacterium]|nr:putative phosphoribosyl transferase [Fibrobacterota bacterium]
MPAIHGHITEISLRIPAGRAWVDGDLAIPEDAKTLIVFAHGTGTGRRNPRNRAIAEFFNEAGYATMLMDLLTAHEESVDETTTGFRYDIPLLARRLIDATEWLAWNHDTESLRMAYYGAGTGSAAALIAAAGLPSHVEAVVSRAGRPDLAGHALLQVKAPTLLIVGSLDETLLGLNRSALEVMACEKAMEIVHGADARFEEGGALEEAARLGLAWFERLGVPGGFRLPAR